MGSGSNVDTKISEIVGYDIYQRAAKEFFTNRRDDYDFLSEASGALDVLNGYRCHNSSPRFNVYYDNPSGDSASGKCNGSYIKLGDKINLNTYLPRTMSNYRMVMDIENSLLNCRFKSNVINEYNHNTKTKFISTYFNINPNNLVICSAHFANKSTIKNFYQQSSNYLVFNIIKSNYKAYYMKSDLKFYAFPTPRIDYKNQLQEQQYNSYVIDSSNNTTKSINSWITDTLSLSNDSWMQYDRFRYKERKMGLEESDQPSTMVCTYVHGGGDFTVEKIMPAAISQVSNDFNYTNMDNNYKTFIWIINSFNSDPQFTHYFDAGNNIYYDTYLPYNLTPKTFDIHHIDAYTMNRFGDWLGYWGVPDSNQSAGMDPSNVGPSSTLGKQARKILFEYKNTYHHEAVSETIPEQFYWGIANFTDLPSYKS